MAAMITEPRYNADGTIDVMWDHPKHGMIPFTAVDPSSDPDRWNNEPEYMQVIWDALQAGEYGPIAPAEAEAEAEASED